MTADEVKKRVDEIRSIALDDEAAHSEEDSLHQAVLAAIRDGTCEDPTECARIALTTQEIDFCPWCA